MKNYWKYMIVALAGLSLFACNKEIEQPENNDVPSAETYSYTIAIDDETKAILDGNHIAWEDGDYVAWYAVSGSASIPGYSEIIVSDPCTFTVKSNLYLGAGGHIYACANYNDVDYSGEAELVIPTDQDGEAITDAMPMVSLPIDIEAPIQANQTSPAGVASFINLGSVIEYNVYTSNTAYESELICGITFLATTPIAGTFSVDLTSVAEDNIPFPSGLAETRVYSELSTPIVPGSSKTAGTKVYQVIAPGAVSGTIIVTTAEATYEYAVNSISFARSSIKTINIDLGSSNAIRKTSEEIEALLTAKTWVLKDVLEAGVSVATSAGNKVTFNNDVDHSMTIDCTANSGQTYDHTWVGGAIAPNAYGDISGMSWWVYPYNGEYYMSIADGYLLVYVQEDPDVSFGGEYTIKTLTADDLVVEITSWDEVWTLEFEAVAPPTVEELLTAHQWELKDVKEAGVGVTTATGNKLTFNSNSSLSFDCTANSGQTFDHTWVGGMISPDSYGNIADMRWSVSESGGVNYITITDGFMLVFAQEGMTGIYEIKELTDSKLKVDIDTYGETWTLEFEANNGSSSSTPTVNELLTAHQWVLSDMLEVGSSVSSATGNKVTFNSNSSLSFDCTANSGQTFDHTWVGGMISPDAYGDIADMRWSVSESGGKDYITITNGYLLVFAQESMTGVYEIKELTDSKLIVDITTYGDTWTLKFDSVSASPI